MPEDERGTVVGPGMLEGSSYLPAPLGVWGGGLRVRIAAGRLRQEDCPIFATLPLITPRPIPAQFEAHVCRDTAEPGGDGVFPSEVPYVAAYPDPNLLAHVLGVVTPNTRIVTPRTRPEWVPTRREKVATSPREARGTPSVPLPVHR